MIEIEFEEPTVDTCLCCGQEIVRLTRFVYQDGNAFAVYYAKFEKGHEKIVYGLVSLGEWGEGAEPKNRVAFPLRIWTIDKEYKVGLVNREESPWSHVEYLGRILDREEALRHPWLKDAFHISDHMVMDDREIVDYLNK